MSADGCPSWFHWFIAGAILAYIAVTIGGVVLIIMVVTGEIPR